MSTFDKCDLSGIVGKHLVYTYDNGWNYELYIKNASTIDYRIHSGMVGNRWVKNQHVYVVRLAQDVYKVSWTEPTGTDVSLAVNLADKIFHGTIFFPRWVMNNPEKTVCFQNDHLEEMAKFREMGPAYPTEIIDEFATLTVIREVGENNESVIDCPPDQLPANWPANLQN